MTSAFGVPQVKKWPFVVGDLILVGVAGWIFVESNFQPAGWNLAMIVACLGLGIFFSVLPFLAEFREESRRFDANQFKSTVEQIQQLESVGELIASATGKWKEVQLECEAVVRTANEVAERTQSETNRLIEISEKADTRERDHLRLEVEKQRRGEREWLEVLVGIMDHVFALHRAAVRSGQAKLIKQIEGFHSACSEICRRVGLSQYVVESGEAFDPKIHKVLEGQDVPASGVVEETLAAGFSFQGHPIRLPMVSVRAESVEVSGAVESDESQASDRDPDLFDQASTEEDEGNAS